MNKRLEEIRHEQILLHGEFYEIGRELAYLEDEWNELEEERIKILEEE